MANVVAAYTGWNSSASAWGDSGWGQDNALTGLTASVGAVTASANAEATVSGLQATSAFGSVTVIGASNVPVTGLAATSAVGGVTVIAAAIVTTTGVSATSAVGAVTGQGGVKIFVTGLFMTTSVGNALVWGNIVPNQNPSYSTIQPAQVPNWERIAA
jgi:hypothetical protein